MLSVPICDFYSGLVKIDFIMIVNDHGRYPYIGIVPNTDEGSQGASPVNG